MRGRDRTVRRSHPNAVFDAYRAPPGFPPVATVDAVARNCEYVASLGRIYPRCSDLQAADGTLRARHR